jgi:phosphoglycolate phosphatase
MSLSLDALNGATLAFDLDGTLVDTAPDLIGALNAVLGQQGLPALPLDSARFMVGRGARALVERGFSAAGAPLDEASTPALVARFLEIYRARIADESRVFDGVEACLETLSSAGAVLVVCTNKPTDLSFALLDGLDLTRYFIAVIGGDLAPKPKPDASHLLAAIAAAKGKPDRAIMIGDSATDIGAAQAAKVQSIVVSFGYTDIPAADLGADLVIDHFSVLPAAVASLLGANPCKII